MKCKRLQDDNCYHALLFSSTKKVVSAVMRLDPYNISYILHRIPKEVSGIENMCTLAIVTNDDVERLGEILEDVMISQFVLMRIRPSDERYRSLTHQWVLSFEHQKNRKGEYDGKHEGIIGSSTISNFKSLYDNNE